MDSNEYLSRPRVGQIGHYYRMKPDGRLGNYIGDFEITRVEGNLAWALYDHHGKDAEPQPFIWYFAKDKEYNCLHIGPWHPDYEPSETEQGLIPIPKEYAEQ